MTIAIDPRFATPAELTAAIRAGLSIAIADALEWDLECLVCPGCGVWQGCAHTAADCWTDDAAAHRAMAGPDECLCAACTAAARMRCHPGGF